MRLVTRGDLDGLACALILKQHEDIEDIYLVGPQEITDKTVEIHATDIIANLPYHPSCGMWFDHRLLTESNETPPEDFNGLFREAPSAAQLVWEYYGEEPRFADLVGETNRFDSSQLSEADVLRPQGYILLGFTLDPRTGFEGDTDFFLNCLGWLAESPINEVLLKPDVQKRVVALFDHNEDFCWSIMDCSQMFGRVLFSDFRRLKSQPIGNRFLSYVLFPDANVSVLALWGDSREKVLVKVGHSIFDRSCETSVGQLMSCYGGGGHVGAGSAVLKPLEADGKLFEIIGALKGDEAASE